MQTGTRRDNLVELLKSSQFARLPELAESLNVSESTVRRDLIELEKSGLVQRTHGGVVYRAAQPHFAVPAADLKAKREIAAAAMELVEEGDTILLDGGSTTLELAKRLAGRKIQVITNSLPVARIFAEDDLVDLVLLGGFVHHRNQVALGPFTVSMLQQLHCRRAFLSAAGINDSGLFNSNLLLVETERAMIQCGDTVTVLADHTKFGRKSTVQLCPLEQIDEMIVDAGMDSRWKSRIRKASINLMIAPVEKSRNKNR